MCTYSFSKKVIPLPGIRCRTRLAITCTPAPQKNNAAANRVKVNRNLITSGTRFVYMWHFENGKRVRKIKGYRHVLSITAVFDTVGKGRESSFSTELENNYFMPYSNIAAGSRLKEIISHRQINPYIPHIKKINKKRKFLSFMRGPGKHLHRLYKKNINPLKAGACAPISTILVKLMKAYGLHAYKIEGTFIREYHNFVLINVNKTEYIVDLTADQFVPNVSPVVLPKDHAFLGPNGRLGPEGVPVYKISVIYGPKQTNLADRLGNELYWEIYDEVLATIK